MSFAIECSRNFKGIAVVQNINKTNKLYEYESIDVWLGNFLHKILGGLGTASCGLNKRHGSTNRYRNNVRITKAQWRRRPKFYALLEPIMYQ